MQMAGRMMTNRTPRRGGVLAGCLIALAVVGVLVAGVSIYVMMNWRGWMSNGVNRVVEDGLAQSSIPEAEKQEVMSVVTSFTADFTAGEVSLEDFAKVLEQLTKSPVMPAMIVVGIEEGYIAKSDLTDEEKADGSKQLSRFVRGVSEGTISQTKIDDVTEPIHAELSDGDKMSIHAGNINVDIKNPDKVTVEELRAFIANAKAEADAAGVPDEKTEIDWSAEIQGAIDRALGRAPALPESGGDDAADDDAPGEDEDPGEDDGG